MTELPAGPRPDRLQGASTQSESGSEALIDGLCRALADAAGRGLLLASGPLSKRKTDWLLCELTDELRQAERLIEALKQANVQRG